VTLGVDVGGTFTDLVWWDGAALHVGKTSSTADQSVGVTAGAAKLTDGRRVPLLVHGTTVATNALLEKKGAVVALVTDPGFEDAVEIARQDRPSLYDSDALRPEPLVPRSLRFGGPPNEPVDADVVAVVFLDSYADPSTERAVAARVSTDNPDVLVIASSDVSREFREFERTSTTILTAYLRPVVESYLSKLDSRVGESVADRVLVMQSSGGLVPASGAGREAASVLLSGPAGGVVAAAAFGELLGRDAVISFDMGGTSTDVCRIEGGAPEVAFERSVEGYVCRLPSVAVHTVGAGGGSLGWVDGGGAVRVGPRSAGARPGPACYGRGGTEPTVTDADLVVGRLSADVPLADGVVLDRRMGQESLRRIGERVGLSPEMAALGMVEIVESHMERAVRRVSVEEGFDPADAALVAFGGAGGMHAIGLAARLGMGAVIVPPHAGVLSALGLLLSAPRTDRARTILGQEVTDESLARIAAEVGEVAAADFTAALGADPRISVSLDMRYRGQSHETTVEYHPGEHLADVIDRFHTAHHRRNGFSRLDDPIEVVTARASATGVPAFGVGDLPSHAPVGEAVVGERTVRHPDGVTQAMVYRRAGLAPGSEVVGPAIVVEGESTAWVATGWRATTHGSGALVIEHG
jgi:N-methylhydantoinase A